MGDRRRVLVPQALGADEFLRMTWHEGRRLVVFSHWRGDHCVAATPVRVADLGELAELAVRAVTRTPAEPGSDTPIAAWPPPEPEGLIALTSVAWSA
jgi:hypothetical protein